MRRRRRRRRRRRKGEKKKKERGWGPRRDDVKREGRRILLTKYE